MKAKRQECSMEYVSDMKDRDFEMEEEQKKIINQDLRN